MKGKLVLYTPFGISESELSTLNKDEITQKGNMLKFESSFNTDYPFALFMELQSKMNKPGFVAEDIY